MLIGVIMLIGLLSKTSFMERIFVLKLINQYDHSASDMKNIDISHFAINGDIPVLYV